MDKITGAPGYHAPPPPYAPIVGPRASAGGQQNNLMSHFVDMMATGYGKVLSDSSFLSDTTWTSPWDSEGSVSGLVAGTQGDHTGGGP